METRNLKMMEPREPAVGQLVAVDLIPGITKIGVFLSYIPKKHETDSVEYAFVGDVVTFSIAGHSKSKHEFEEWKLESMRLTSTQEKTNYEKVHHPPKRK